MHAAAREHRKRLSLYLSHEYIYGGFFSWRTIRCQFYPERPSCSMDQHCFHIFFVFTAMFLFTITSTLAHAKQARCTVERRATGERLKRRQQQSHKIREILSTCRVAVHQSFGRWQLTCSEDEGPLDYVVAAAAAAARIMLILGACCCDRLCVCLCLQERVFTLACRARGAHTRKSQTFPCMIPSEPVESCNLWKYKQSK